MKQYELMTIFKPNLDAEEVDKLIEKVNSVISDFGGKVESVDKAGRKKLAYEIQKFRDGYFSTTIFELSSEKVAEFKRQLRLNDNILRTMFMEVSTKASV
ncbi:30S ribosomal protein S6 [bacterium]|nr:30S ribosomal protein S6 [bacterium]